MSATAPAFVEIGDSVIFQTLQDEVVILNLASQQYYGLDNIGASMWKVLIDCRDVGAAADRLVAQYDAGPEKVREDLHALVCQLVESGLLKPVGV